MSGVHPHLSGFEERITGCCAVINSDHAYIHQGIAFSLPFNTGSLNAEASYKISLTTPAASTGKYIHFRPAIFSTSANYATMKIYEGSVISDGSNVQAFNRNRNSSTVSSVVCKSNVTADFPGITALGATAGGGFTNQPAGDALEILSDNAADIAQTVTVYGTKTGTTTTVTSETITLKGTTAVATTEITWQNILGIEVSANHAGTITVREASGSATVTTLATGTNSAGIASLTLENAYGSIPRHDCSGASTAPVGIMGYTEDGTAISSVDALNGATEEDHGTIVFWAVSKVLIGAVAADRNVTVLSQRPGTRFSYSYIPGATGVGGTKSVAYYGGSSDCFLLKPATKYVIRFDNGSSGDNVVQASLLFCEHSQL